MMVSMDIIRTAVRQAFMPKHEYHRLREEEKAWNKLRIPVYITIVGIICLAIVTSSIISLIIVWPEDSPNRPFCDDLSFQFNESFDGSGLYEEDMINVRYIKDQEAVGYYYRDMFFPSLGLFLASFPFLVTGMTAAYSAPRRHLFLRLYESNYCTSRRGGVCILIVLNVSFAVAFALLAIFHGPTVITPGSSCSLPLFWCYETALWGLVILLAGTSIVLKRRSAGMPNADQEVELTSETTQIENFINHGLQHVDEIVSQIIEPYVQP